MYKVFLDELRYICLLSIVLSRHMELETMSPKIIWTKHIIINMFLKGYHLEAKTAPKN